MWVLRHHKTNNLVVGVIACGTMRLIYEYEVSGVISRVAGFAQTYDKEDNVSHIASSRDEVIDQCLGSHVEDALLLPLMGVVS